MSLGINMNMNMGLNWMNLGGLPTHVSHPTPHHQHQHQHQHQHHPSPLAPLAPHSLVAVGRGVGPEPPRKRARVDGHDGSKAGHVEVENSREFPRVGVGSNGGGGGGDDDPGEEEKKKTIIMTMTVSVSGRGSDDDPSSWDVSAPPPQASCLLLLHLAQQQPALLVHRHIRILYTAGQV